MVPRKRILKAQQVLLCRDIHQLIDLGQRITVFWACFVQIGEVHAHPPSSISFLDEHHIQDPLRILALSNEACLQQVLHLRSCYRDPLGAHLSLVLVHWLVSRIYV